MSLVTSAAGLQTSETPPIDGAAVVNATQRKSGMVGTHERAEQSRYSKRSRHNPAAADGPSMQTAYFAGGCFWGLERYFQNVDGVTRARSVTRSRVESPSYEQVCAGVTDAAETMVCSTQRR